MKKIITMLFALILTVAMAGAALADTIAPNPGKIDIEHLEDRFVTANVEYKGNGIATLTLVENEQYAADAVKAIKAGDIIVSEGQEIKVDTVKWDGPDLLVNEGTQDEALLCDAGDGVFERVEENDRVPMQIIGTMECEILPGLVMLDWVDPVTGEILDDPALRTGEELKALLEKGDGPSFAVENVRVLFDNNNQPALVWRF